MGRFVNPDNSAFQVALNSKIYVDKTGLIEEVNQVLDTTNGYICNSRPRRFCLLELIYDKDSKKHECIIEEYEKE